MQPRRRPLRSPARRGRLAPLLGLVAPFALDAGPAPAAPMSIGSPTFYWRLDSYLFDAQGSTTQAVIFEGHQIGGEVGDSYEAPLFPNSEPDAAVFSNAWATTFWVSADAAHTLPGPLEGDPVGGAAVLGFRQSFRKDEANASLSYKLTEARIIGLDPSDPNDSREPEGYFTIQVEAYDELGPHGESIPFFLFIDGPFLTGMGGRWGFTPATSFSMAPKVGSLDQSYVELSLTAPFTLQVDISDVPVGAEFTLHYQLWALAQDTAQTDTGITVFARDPADPESGSYFEYAGLTPTDNPLVVPEPGRPALLLAGAALLLGLRRAPRRSSRRLASTLAGVRALPITRS